MKLSDQKWRILLFLTVIALFSIYDFCWELKFHYFEDYNGIVIEKQHIPPKEMPELLIKGNKTTFPVWKWEGINFDSVQIGDSIVKRKYESHAYYFKKLKNGKFEKATLTYWVH